MDILQPTRRAASTVLVVVSVCAPLQVLSPKLSSTDGLGETLCKLPFEIHLQGIIDVRRLYDSFGFRP